MLRRLISRFAPTAGARRGERLLADAEALLAGGEPAAAETLLRDWLRAAPSEARAHELLGQALRRRGDPLAASHALVRAIELEGGSLTARTELARCLVDLGRPGDALPLLRWVLKRDPNLAAAHLANGIALQELARLEDALAAFQRAAALAPPAVEPACHLAMCLRALDRHPEAARELERVLALAPEAPDPARLLAIVLRELGAADRAAAVIQPAVAARPDDVEARCVLAQVLQELGDLDGARSQFDAALERDPRAASARVGRALLRLAQGDFAGGWDDYAARLDSAETPRRGFPFPEWDGGPLAARSVLVYAEQGLGDEIMFASCIPDLVAEAARVVLECDPRLAALFARSFPGVQVQGAPRTREHAWLASAGAIDVQIAAGSLPGRYRRHVGAFPGARGYLRADPAGTARWRGRLDALAPARKIGLAWRGGLVRTRRNTRSLSATALAPLLARPDVHWISLQHDATVEELAALRAVARGGLTHWPEAWSNADEAASLMSALEAVVTVCSSVVHLGGALGVRVLTLVPASPEWRYLVSGSSMPWYPSVELVRQPRAGDWQPVVAAVTRRLDECPAPANPC